jgi:hypothetical protein
MRKRSARAGAELQKKLRMRYVTVFAKTTRID